MNIINEFNGKYFFLSNFFPCKLIYNGRIFENSEAAFQSEKCINELEKDQFMGLSASESKKLGRKVALRSDWDSIKDEVMYNIVKAKFEQNPNLAILLLDTKNDYLAEGTSWNDKYWGICPPNGIVGIDGLNMLGTILMRVRSELRFRINNDSDKK